MPFIKGGKPGPGKPKGTKNQKTLEWEKLGQYVCEKGAEKYFKLLTKLSDEEYMTRYEHLLEYFKPKLARSEQNITGLDEKDKVRKIVIEFVDPNGKPNEKLNSIYSTGERFNKI